MGAGLPAIKSFVLDIIIFLLRSIYLQADINIYTFDANNDAALELNRHQGGSHKSEKLRILSAFGRGRPLHIYRA